MPSFSHSRRAIRLQLPAMAPILGTGLGVLRLWLRRARTRHELACLSPWQMRDIGLDPRRVRRESAKPFWRA